MRERQGQAEEGAKVTFLVALGALAGGALLCWATWRALFFCIGVVMLARGYCPGCKSHKATHKLHTPNMPEVGICDECIARLFPGEFGSWCRETGRIRPLGDK